MEIQEMFQTLLNEMKGIKANQEELGCKFDKLESKVDKLEFKIDKLESKVDKLEKGQIDIQQNIVKIVDTLGSENQKIQKELDAVKKVTSMNFMDIQILKENN